MFIGNLDDFDPYYGFDPDFSGLGLDYLDDVDFDPLEHGYSMYCPSFDEIAENDVLSDISVLPFEDVDEEFDDSHILFV